MKENSCNAAPSSLLLRGGENRIRNAAAIRTCEVLYHKATKIHLKAIVARTKGHRKRIKTARKCVLSKPQIEDVLRMRQLLFSGRVPKMKNSTHPKTL